MTMLELYGSCSGVSWPKESRMWACIVSAIALVSLIGAGWSCGAKSVVVVVVAGGCGVLAASSVVELSRNG